MSDEGTGPPGGFETAVLAVISRIPEGEVATYGEVAAEAGYPGAARAVGNLLRATVEPVPWWRVVGSDGRLVAHEAEEQARMLRSEGLPIQGGRVRFR